MAKNNYIHTNYSIQALKEKVQQRAGFDIINMRDCKNLSGKLEAQGLHISPHTIGRIFQVIKNNNRPSKFTLDQLADYTGYDHWQKFHDTISKAQLPISDQAGENETYTIDSELSLIRFCLQDGAYTPLINYLRSNRQILERGQNKKMGAILNTISQSILKQRKDREKIFSLLNQEVPWAKAYFKYLIHGDAINSFYGNAVKEHFFRIIHPSENEYHSQLTWGYAILAMQAFYNGQKKKFSENGYELFRQSPPEDNTLAQHTYGKETQIWVYARYHFVHLLYLHFSEKLNLKTLENKLLCMATELQKTNIDNIAITLAFLFEALWFTGNSSEILNFTDAYFKVISNMHKSVKLKGEILKSLISMILFYQEAVTRLKQDIDKTKPDRNIQLIEQEFEKPLFKPFQHTYQVYLNELYALLATDQKEKEAFFQKARQHAGFMKNKYFLKQIDRMKRDNL
ncbi:hypothetical protein L21SP5_01149 [Salinivirga cyanobacteriivorans]|uniref:HTH cro/C1-type domain-containing protein n=1 Tax=Salinivirga cyanobacteriivorans TaxID=1307839 RepID=A0A0S2HXL9_9BACT|nr:hypothetical protein [Salinivirga cyanobacteriivorans]ALO14808.1 hypothetical protein L21SP5_01149 [Salinivirga cyanobacteriivorans]